MGRKGTQTENRARRYIRILNDERWVQIDRLCEIKKYKNSFNRIINDALDYGLPLLIKAEFGEIEEEQQDYDKRATSQTDAEFYGQVIRLLGEITINATINKSILSSLFEARKLELQEKAVSGEAFASGGFQETPKYIEDYELRALRALRD